jgi:hypothetical protein
VRSNNMRNGIRRAAIGAALAVILVPSLALAQTAETPPAELVQMLFASWGAWSVVVGLGLLIAIQVWRKLKPKVWDSMHPIARRVLPPTVSALTTAAVGLASGATWAEFGQVFVVQWVTLAWAADIISPLDVSKVTAAIKGTTVGILVLLVTGCAPSLATVSAETPQVGVGAMAPEDADMCRRIDKREMVLRRAAQVSAALAGGSGLAAIPVGGEDEQTALAISAGVFGAVAVGAEAWREAEAADFARKCE